MAPQLQSENQTDQTSQPTVNQSSGVNIGGEGQIAHASGDTVGYNKIEVHDAIVDFEHLSAWAGGLSSRLRIGLKKWIRDSWLYWVLIAIAVSAILIFEPKLWIAIVVGVSLPFILYRALPRSARSWLKDYSFLYVAVIIFILAIALLALWTLTNWVVPAQQLLVNTALYQDSVDAPTPVFEFGPGQSRSLEARYPSLILADDQPADFMLVVRKPLTPTETITASTAIPVGLQLVNAPEEQNLMLVFPAGSMVTRTFSLASTRTDGSLLWGNTPLQLDLYLNDLTTPYSVTLRFQTEGTWGRAAREFVNSTVNEKSPLIILVAALLSGVGATLSNFLKQQREKEDDKRKEGIQKYTDGIEQFKDAIRSRDKDLASKLLTELERPELVVYTDSKLKIVQTLWQLINAASESDIVTLVKDTRVWDVECAHAFLMCHKQLYNDIPNRLREAMTFIPRDQLPGNLHDELANASKQLSDSQVPQLQGEMPQPSPSEFAFIKKVLKGTNPFPCERAEDDQALLFGKPRSCFWTRHPIFANLLRGDCPWIVFGERGSGKTALALALGKYNVDSGFRFSLYLPGQPDIYQIKTGYAQYLLSFVQKYPTRLGELTQADLALLARVWASVLGKEYVLAEIKSTQVSGHWWDGAKTPFEKQNLERIGKIQLTLLNRAIELATVSKSNEPHWPREIGRCAHALGFNQGQIMLLLDSSGDSPDWPNGLVRNFYPWWQAGLTTILFLPQALEPTVRPVDGVTVCTNLTWTPDDLRQMIQYRFQEVFRGQIRSQLSSTVFESDDVFAHLVQASKSNPQRFMHIWNACLHEVGKKSKIGTADLNAALNRSRSGQIVSELNG